MGGWIPEPEIIEDEGAPIPESNKPLPKINGGALLGNGTEPINLDVDTRDGVVTATDLRVNFKDLAQKLATSRRPAIVTSEGRSRVVVMSPELFEQIKARLRVVEG